MLYCALEFKWRRVQVGCKNADHTYASDFFPPDRVSSPQVTQLLKIDHSGLVQGSSYIEGMRNGPRQRGGAGT